MDRAVTLKVDTIVYTDTLTKLDGILTKLKGKQEQLKADVEKLGTDAFRGSDVSTTIELANKQMDYVQNAINKVTSQYEAIRKHLEAKETHSTTLQSDVSGIDQALPDIFANS